MTASVLYDIPGPVTRRRTTISTAVAGVALAGLIVLVLVQLGEKGQLEADKWGPIFSPFNQYFVAVWTALGIGLVNTMVFTHLPSNVLLILVPLMPTLPLAILVLLLRYSLSQMDVPTRQSYVMAVVEPDERSAAAGVTGVARTTGAAISPSLSSVMMASVGYAAVPFYLAGGLKILYDLLMYRDFRNVKPPEERARG